ncbi:hypothetical protein K440DRAFT_86072 [Wilcoxina mikolae CBS 423.85]|nr:hypothetical protein K440DRAFT_86072 [Wilcoxina mikolae CBS 423.85]
MLIKPTILVVVQSCFTDVSLLETVRSIHIEIYISTNGKRNIYETQEEAKSTFSIAVCALVPYFPRIPSKYTASIGCLL